LSATTTNLPGAPVSPSAWKDEVSARLHAHRSGRGRVPDNQPVLPGMEPAAPSAIAARVAQRYARVPSWREAMAAEAAAKAAAAAAASDSRSETPALPQQPSLLSPTPAVDHPAAQEVPAPPRESRTAPLREPQPPSPPRPFQPDLIRYSVSLDSLPAPRSAPAEARVQSHVRTVDAVDILDDPIEEATVEPTSPLPARVIEFPRELVAPRKARPRLALGPLLEDERLAIQAPAPQGGLFSGTEELRIVEADSEIAGASAPGWLAPIAANVPEWHSIQLDSEEPMRATQAAITPSRLVETNLYVAPIQDRIMASVVDVALTLVAFLAFILVFAACTTHLPAGKPALAGAGATLLAMWVLYQFLFFTLSAATPGMRYAKIALCTFEDENPSRTAMRGRIAALLLSALPLGLGFLWALFDEDGLCWHDRITRTYQRSYREM